MRIWCEEGLLSSSSERRISHRFAGLSFVGVQARERKFQAWRSRRSARDQTTCLETCAHTPRLIFDPQDSDRTASYTACRAADAGSRRIAAERFGVQFAQHALTNPTLGRHVRIPQPESSSFDGRHDALPPGAFLPRKSYVTLLTQLQWNQELTHHIMDLVPDPEHNVHKNST